MKKRHQTSSLLLLSVLVGSATGCSQTSELPPARDPELSVAVLDCGNVTINDLSVLTPGQNEGVVKTLTSTCFLVRHPKGMLLWNTGIADEVGVEPIDVFGGVFTLSVTHPLLEQLDALGVSPGEIDYLALSHFHDDHTGNANRFAKSRLLIQRAEAEVAFGESAEASGFAPSTYQAFTRDSATVLDGIYDVFGDGTVVIHPAPGHTPGHQVLFIALEKTGPVVLSGDLYHFAKARTEQTVPSFNSDPVATRKAMSEIESLIEETNAQLWIQHDYEQMSKIERAPHWYR